MGHSDHLPAGADGGGEGAAGSDRWSADRSPWEPEHFPHWGRGPSAGEVARRRRGHGLCLSGPPDHHRHAPREAPVRREGGLHNFSGVRRGRRLARPAGFAPGRTFRGHQHAGPSAFDEGGEADLASYHPHSSAQEVVDNTGWDLAVASDVTATPPPTEEELAVIREYDPAGFWAGG